MPGYRVSRRTKTPRRGHLGEPGRGGARPVLPPALPLARACPPVQVLEAVPAGSKRIRGRDIERQYLTAIGSWPALLELRPVARINLLEVAKQLARRASYRDGTTRRGAKPFAALAGVCSSTWKAARRRLEAWGFLGCVQEGTTPEFAPMALARQAANLAAVYVLCIPRKMRSVPASPQVSPLTRPPTQSGRTVVLSPARAREANPGEPRTPIGAGSAGAQDLRHVAGLMRKATGQPVSDGWCAWLWRPFAAAGWSVRDLAWAVDHEPGGAQHRYSARIRHPVGWLRHRLGLWLDQNTRSDAAASGRRGARTPDRTAVPSMTAQRQASRDRAAAQREQWRASMAAAAAGWTDPAPHAARIRANLRWQRHER